MRWQRAAQAVIALLVLGFIVVLVTTLRKERSTVPPPSPAAPLDKDATLQTPGGIDSRYTDASGRVLFAVKATKHFLYPDGRNVLSEDIEITTNRNRKNLVVTADDGEFMPRGGDLDWAKFRGNVGLTTDGGTDVHAQEAHYTKEDGIVTIAGPLEFTKGRMRGSGVGATYDQNREVLWILDQAKIAVAPDAGGQGGLDAVAAKAGLARAEHYLVLEKDARIDGEGRRIEADLITIRLTEDDERVQLLELRGHSRITGGSAGTQAMSATDIDLTYGEDGRTLQFAKLAQNAVLQLPGTGGTSGKRVAGDAIDLALGPDGTTVTNLTANGRVQVDLPAEAGAPSRRIRSATLLATGAPDTGLQNATFGGGVEYGETQTARKGAAAVDRTARSQTLVVETKPGFGALQEADFRGNVKFADAPDFHAEAQQGVYDIAGDRLELMPSEGQPGPASPRVTDGKVSVAARTIEFILSSRQMTADTKVRSTIMPGKATTPESEARIPSMLNQEKEVNVTSNRLSYTGTGATYSGNATLWQEKTTIKGGTIVIDEKSGNLTASGGATTFFIFDETNRKTRARTPVESTGKAEIFTYEDAGRLATYTGQAQIDGGQGNVSGDRIQLFLKPDSNELERAEAYGTDGSVIVREGPRIAKGNRLTYTAETDHYLMTGTPVEVVEEQKGTCSITLGATVTFSRTSDTASVKGNGTFPHTGRTLPKCPAGLGR